MSEPAGRANPKLTVWILGLLLVALAARLYRFDAPMVDSMYPKQIYNANKARNIARDGWNPLRTELDFLGPDGKRSHLLEEVPVYSATLAAAYRLLGEHDWIGRAMSLVATLAGILVLHALVRRELDPTTALAAAFFSALAPLSIFYGRAVFPDPAMITAMLAAAYCHRRYWDENQSARWLAATIAAGIAATFFKYYGLLILLPLADQARRLGGGYRACLRPRFLMLAAGIAAPIVFWTLLVFLQSDNPAGRAAYIVFSEPEALFSMRFLDVMTVRLLFKDFGAIGTAMVLMGLAASLRRLVPAGPAPAWTLTGLAFLVLFAPKVHDHDYYEMIIQPGLAMWAGLGFTALMALLAQSRTGARSHRLVTAALVAACVIVQSPPLTSGKFEPERGFVVVAERLKALCGSPSSGTYVILGNESPWAIAHYAQRPGWALQAPTLPEDWRESLARYRALGADFAVLYFDPTATPDQRASFEPLRDALPVVESQTGPWGRRHRTCEYLILGLDGLDTWPEAIAARAELTPRR